MTVTARSAQTLGTVAYRSGIHILARHSCSEVGQENNSIGVCQNDYVEQLDDPPWHGFRLIDRRADRVGNQAFLKMSDKTPHGWRNILPGRIDSEDPNGWFNTPSL